MNIVFRTKKMERIFNSSQKLYKEYGFLNGGTIMKRMVVLRAAPSLGDVPHQKPERRHQLIGDRDEEFAVDLKYPFRLVFVPNHDPIPRKNDEGIDIFKVTSIKIIGVEDYHK